MNVPQSFSYASETQRRLALLVALAVVVICGACCAIYPRKEVSEPGHFIGILLLKAAWIWLACDLVYRLVRPVTLPKEYGDPVLLVRPIRLFYPGMILVFWLGLLYWVVNPSLEFNTWQVFLAVIFIQQWISPVIIFEKGIYQCGLHEWTRFDGYEWGTVRTQALKLWLRETKPGGFLSRIGYRRGYLELAVTAEAKPKMQEILASIFPGTANP